MQKESSTVDNKRMRSIYNDIASVVYGRLRRISGATVNSAEIAEKVCKEIQRVMKPRYKGEVNFFLDIYGDEETRNRAMKARKWPEVSYVSEDAYLGIDSDKMEFGILWVLDSKM